MRRVLLFGLALVAVLVAVRFSLPTVDARAQPGWLESTVATHVRSWLTPSKYDTMPNPVSCDASALAAARAHWADHCATCHANNGNGQTMLGRGMYPKPPDMRATGTQSQSDGRIYATIRNGVPLTGMPAFGQPTDGDKETWALVCFVRHLPSMTPDEELAMRAMNPKTDADREEERQEAEFLNGGSVP